MLAQQGDPNPVMYHVGVGNFVLHKYIVWWRLFWH